MKKVLLSLLCALVASTLASAQWVTTPNGIQYSSGLVTIGENSTTGYKLDLAGRGRLLSSPGGWSAGLSFMNSTNSSERAFIGMGPDDNFIGIYGWGLGNWGLAMNVNNGFVGLGTSSPAARLDIDVAQSGLATPAISLRNSGSGQNWSGVLSFSSSATAAPFHIYTWDNELQFSQRYGDGSYKSHFMIFKNQNGDVIFPNSTGKVGIGTETPTAKLQVAGTIDAQNFTINGTPFTGSGSSHWTTASGATIAYAAANAKVGIGTTNPGSYTLAVAGKIGSWGEVRVLSLNAPFPDYVFAPDYKLRPLTDVASYIKQHRHLPEVPSAQEVEEKGLGLSEMHIISMKKIEELTLYLIQLQEKVERLEQKNQALEEQLAQKQDK